jgi:hypothetical protein
LFAESTVRFVSRGRNRRMRLLLLSTDLLFHGACGLQK